ncbi:MAG: DUF2703 domain-containing protein [Candidatus Hydrothermarchaeaceae archaeon]
MKIELLYFDGCPTYKTTIKDLRALLKKGIEEEVKLIRVGSEQEAEKLRFLGSPTVRINDLDIEEEARDSEAYGLKCRIYMTEEGITPSPPKDMILKALEEAER